MWPDRVSNPGPPTYESGALPIALRGPALLVWYCSINNPSRETCIAPVFLQYRSSSELLLISSCADMVNHACRLF